MLTRHAFFRQRTARQTIFGGGPSVGAHSHQPVVAATVRLRRAGLSRVGGLYGPGNWATDIQGGSQFGYELIWVLLMSNAMAVLLQTLSARLGLVTGRDLAQACHDDYPQAINYILFVLCEIAIAACDLAEVLGSAIGLNLLFGIPVLWGVLITGCDVLLLLVIQHFGIRKLEAFILMLVATIGLCFLVKIFLCKPSVGGIVAGFVPHFLEHDKLYIAIGIIGATVMPHNLYLHSALVQSRDVTRSRQAVTEACHYNFVDSAIAMNGAFFINAAILIVAAATGAKRQFKRIGVALDALSSDAAMLAEAVALAKTHRAGLVLMHVVDGVGGTWYGPQTGDKESRDDQRYVESLADRLRGELRDEGVPSVEAVLGYGDATAEIVAIARQQNLDLMVLGGHGHRGLWDLLHGYTISGVRHGLDIPIVAVRGGAGESGEP